MFSNILSLDFFLTKQIGKVFLKIIRLQRKSSSRAPCTYYLSITTVLRRYRPYLTYLVTADWHSRPSKQHCNYCEHNCEFL